MYFNYQTALTCIICAPLIFGVVGYKVYKAINKLSLKLRQ